MLNTPVSDPSGVDVPLEMERMATSSFWLGVLAILLNFFFPLALPDILGSMAILFAILSRGGASRMPSRAKAGLIAGLLSIGLNIFMITSSFLLVRQVIQDPSANARVYQSLTQSAAAMGISEKEMLRLLRQVLFIR